MFGAFAGFTGTLRHDRPPLSLCQVENRLVQTGGSMGHKNLHATYFSRLRRHLKDNLKYLTNAVLVVSLGDV